LEAARLKVVKDYHQQIFDTLVAERNQSGNTSLRLKAAIDEAQKEKDKATSEYDARANSPEVRRLAALGDSRKVISRLTSARISSLAVGDGEGEQFVNQQRGIESAISNRMLRYQSSNNAEDRDNLRVETYQLRSQWTEMAVKGEERLLELQREGNNLLIQRRREYERMLLTAGPSDLLRKLAVNQLGRNGFNTGSFFALSSEARQDFLSRPENSEDIRQNRRDQDALRRGGYGIRTDRQIQFGFSAGQNLNRELGNAIVGATQINEAARTAAGSIISLARAAEAATAALENVTFRGRGGGSSWESAVNPQSPHN
jgi:hypothetical protein